MKKSDLSPEYLFSNYLERSLNQEEQVVFEERYASDPAFARVIDNASALAGISEKFNSPPLPLWDKSRSFGGLNRMPNASYRWFSMAAMAMSVCAMVMVLTGVQIRVDEQGVMFGTSVPQSSDTLHALVDDKLSRFHQENQILLTNYADALALQQQKSSAALTQYLLTSSRKERQADFAELVSFINDQRRDDQRFMTRQLSVLQREIDTIGHSYSQSVPATYLMSEEDE